MPRQTPAAQKALRARAIAAGINYDALPPVLRQSSITNKPGRRPLGILPISDRVWERWTKEGLVPQPIVFDSGIHCWLRDDVIRIALSGVYRERKLLRADNAAPSP